jgi:tRNA(fMet)-specific endonuclease VapC
MILLDTNILIEIFKGNTDVIMPVQQVGPENLALSAVTAMELYYGALNNLELKRIRKHLGAFHCLQISTSISVNAMHLIERYSKSHGLQIPDALIAATAMEYKCELMTLNLKDFRFISALKIKKL